MRYRGASVGYLFLSHKVGGAAFTAADEEVLMLFAAQAAAAIGNAREHASERRAHESERRAHENERRAFLGLVSHELRTPLTSITGSAVALLDESEALDPAAMREFFRIIFEQAGHMRGLIADLLDAGRIDAGTLSISPEPSTVVDLVERARSVFLTADAGRSLVLTTPPVLSVHVAAT